MVTICGIAGFSLNPSDPTATNARRMAGIMLKDIESRGRDATGAAWYDPTGNVTIQKGPFKATAFVRNLSIWKKATTAVLHTRAWTQGTPENPDNNHPIATGGIVGVHNGCIHNDWELFNYTLQREAPRYGEVDSEAAFATLAWGEAVTGLGMMDLLGEVEGSAALAWLDENDQDQALHLARLYSSPLHVMANEHGSLFFASTRKAILDVFARIGCKATFEWAMEEGQYIKVVDGHITEGRQFKPAGPTYRTWGSYAATSKAAGSSSKVTSIGSAASTNKYGRTLTPGTTRVQTVDDFREEWERENDQYLSDFRTGKNYDLDSRLLDLTEHVEYDPSNFPFDFRVRMNVIDRYVDTYGHAQALTNGCNLRPGDWVWVEFGTDWQQAQLVSIPDTFPGGKYILRVVLTDSGTPDVAIIQRTVDCLEWSPEIDDRSGPASRDLSDFRNPQDDLGDLLGKVLDSIDLSPDNDDDDHVAELYVPALVDTTTLF